MSYKSKITAISGKAIGSVSCEGACWNSCIGSCSMTCARYCEVSVGMMAVNVEKVEM